MAPFQVGAIGFQVGALELEALQMLLNPTTPVAMGVQARLSLLVGSGNGDQNLTLLLAFERLEGIMRRFL